MRNQTKSGSVTALKFSSQIAPLFGVFVGGLVLLGWIFDIATLRSTFPGLIEMKANTASAFLLLGVSLWLLRDEPADRPRKSLRRRLAHVFAFVVALAGVLTLGEYLLGRDFGIDQLLFQEAPGAVGTSSPGRMAPTTALNFVLLGCALLFLDVETSRGRRPAQLLGLTAGIVAYLAMTGYLHNVVALYRLTTLTGMALNTSLTFVVLSLGVVFARPGRGMTAVLTSESMGGHLARRFLPAVFFIPLILGWLRMAGQTAGLYGAELGLALYATTNVLAFATLMYWASLSLEHTDAERKRTVEALRNNEKWLSTTLASIGDAVIATDQNGAITFMNAVAQALTGWTEPEAKGKSLDLVFDIVNQATRQPVENPVKKVFREGKIVGLADDTVLISKDRREFDIEDSAAPIVTGEGERIGVVLVFRDVTESKKLEGERDRLFLLSRDMICTAGFDGYFKHLNPAWQKTLGYTPEELLGKPYLEFVHPEDRAATLAEAQKLTTGVETISFENRYLAKDGLYHWLSWNSTPVPDQQVIYATARDVTERKQAEAALQRAKEQAERTSKFKDQFLSTMSHELRTPLNAVLGFSELLSDTRYGALNDKQHRYLGHIRSGGQHLLKLINDILDLSKIEAGRLELAIEDVKVANAFAEVANTLRPLAEKKSQNLVQTSTGNLAVRADLVRFKQILMNLLGNAIKFTPEKGRIELSAHAMDGSVRVEVRDTGPGIPPEEQKRIFEAFYRLQTSGHSAEGTGLGLAITQRLVELHRGQLGLESQLGKGSCFHFSLPAASGFGEAPARNGTVSQKPEGAPRILVIEDDPVAGQLLMNQLSSCGYEPILCLESQRAFQMASELLPRAITLDLLMSPLTGWELLLELKNDPRTKDLPVIVVSIVDQPGIGVTLGADEFLVKPVEKETLLNAIQRCIATRGHAPEPGPILVVEDDSATREVIAELLQSHGYRVFSAEDGAEARAWVEVTLPELVILDLLLPRVSGFELLAEWRASPRTAEVPVFVLTSKDLTSAEEKVVRAQAELLLRKQRPWQDELLLQLRRVLPETQAEAS